MSDGNSGTGHRPDTFFVQTQFMPWLKHHARGEGCHKRVVSRNPKTSAESSIMRFEPGYRLMRPGYLKSDFEFLVVEGEVELNGRSYTPGCYGMHPAGYAHNSFFSATGATVIAITLGGPDELHLGDAQSMYRVDRLAEHIDVSKIHWHYGVDRRLVGPRPYSAPKPIGQAPKPPSTMTKLIWQDPDSNGYTFMKCDLPRVSQEPQRIRTHTIDAEYFVLQGDYIISGEGRMAPGAYFFWAAGAMHGPSAYENLSLSFSKYYGPVGLAASKDEIEVTLDPEHNPSVPKEMEDYARPLQVPDVWS